MVFPAMLRLRQKSENPFAAEGRQGQQRTAPLRITMPGRAKKAIAKMHYDDFLHRERRGRREGEGGAMPQPR